MTHTLCSFLLLATLLVAGTSLPVRAEQAAPRTPIAGDGTTATATPTGTSADVSAPGGLPTRVENQIWLPLVHAPAARTLGKSVFGVHTEGLSDERGLLEAHDLGLTWLRRGVLKWRWVQPEQDSPYNWEALGAWEQEFIAASAAGVTPIVIIGGSPRWATTVPSDCGPIKTEAFDEFAAFMQAMVERYSKPPYNVKYWELGNEPDVEWTAPPIDSGFGCWGKIADERFFGGEQYGNMLRAVYPVIKAADPEAQVLLGGLLLSGPTGYANEGNPQYFLRGVLEAQKNDPQLSFDILSYHAYGYYAYNSAQPQFFNPLGGFVLGKAAFLRQELAAYNRSVPLMNTETAMLCFRLSTDCRQKQADYALRIYVETMAGGLLGSMWYIIDTDEFYNSGLVDRTTRAPRPSYITMKVTAEQLRNATYIGPLENQPRYAQGYRFQRGSQTVVVAWAQEIGPNVYPPVIGTSGTITVPPAIARIPQPFGTNSVACTNRDAIPVPCQLVNGEVSYTLGRSPVYIVFQ